MRPEQLLAAMSLEEKIGQLFQVGFSGREINYEIEKMIVEYSAGGVILFARNIVDPVQTAELTGELQKRAKIPLLISADQEGGPVTRLNGATHFPSNMVLGAAGDPVLAGEQGKIMARELRASGINMNLAPVLDVNNNPANPVIGVRSFGENPELVAELGTAFISGLQGEGVASCAKHFPGHGDTETDSHQALPIIGHGRERLEKVELLPFRRAIAAGVDCIMTAHVHFPAFEDDQETPATLSPSVLRRLLREEMGFQGLIITDCMEMKAITDNFGTGDGAVRAIAAGADIVLISHNLGFQIEAFEGVLKAVKDGRLDVERINDAAFRVLNLKSKLFSSPGREKILPGQFDREGGDKLARKIAERGLTLVADPGKTIPFSGKRLKIVEFRGRREFPDREKEKTPAEILAEMLKEEGLETTYHPLARKAQVSEIQGGDPIIFCSYNARRDPEQKEILYQLSKGGEEIMVAGLSGPYDAEITPPPMGFITPYDSSPHCLLALAGALSGRLKPAGRLPVTIRKEEESR